VRVLGEGLDLCAANVQDERLARDAAEGEMAEWLKAPVSKTGGFARAPWVRIPLSPFEGLGGRG
jgi:hypothetical protein